MIVKCVLWCRGDDTDPRGAAGPQPDERKRTDIAFLIAQLGAYAAERFGERAAALDFTRPQAGLLRLISREPGPEPAGRRPPARHPAEPAGRAGRRPGTARPDRTAPQSRRPAQLRAAPHRRGGAGHGRPEPGRLRPRAGHQRAAHPGRTRPAEQAPGQAGRRSRPGARSAPRLPQPQEKDTRYTGRERAEVSRAGDECRA